MSQVAPMTESAPVGDANANAADAAPEIVSEFPAPPAFFALYRDGADSGPPPPAPLAPTYHMFGTPFSTLDAVPDLLPQLGRKLYAREGTASSAVSSASGSPTSAVGPAGSAQAVEPHENERVDYKAQMKKWALRFIMWLYEGVRTDDRGVVCVWQQDQSVVAGEFCGARGRADQAAVNVQVSKWAGGW